ncbi:YitT family protein [Nocardioides limicola]|uniref:YitT family protein n=1 Tax=Nocardioides limicola TaxID=2803368 RepID=UPI0027DE51BF|nr:YitT family protein [Nocardioides sp. DJM-14]
MNDVLQASPPHSWVDDLFAMASGTVVVSFGVHLLSSVEAVTGGTAGLALLISYWTGLAFGLAFVAINLPFFALALARKGWRFTAQSLIAVLLVGALSAVHPRLLDASGIQPTYAILLGNLLIGIGLLILFRHGSSVGGFNIIALLAQERLGWRAGYVQMSLDVAVVLAAFAVVTPSMVLLSALGAALLNLVLALNHRPGRYFGI